jgi:hypothetical protein
MPHTPTSTAGPQPRRPTSRPAGQPPADGETDAQTLVRLYVDEGLSTYRIARRVGMDRQAVARRLHAAGVVVSRRGAGRARPLRRHGDHVQLAERLRELSVDKRLTATDIGRLLGMPPRTVRDRLRAYGIPGRTRGGCQREDRAVVPTATLHELYVEHGHTAAEVAQLVGSSRGVVLRSAHDAGLPVRLGHRPAGPEEIRLVAALYADRRVRRTLIRHHLPVVPAGAPIWMRFPQPVPVSVAAVGELYQRCGLAFRHIELLTGHPAQTLRRRLAAAGVARRPAGGRAPFLRRWQAARPGRAG